jgi:dTDP-D-glucose 4,6-dehydratase
MIRERKVRLHNGGTPIRNWLHADDTAEAVMTIIDSNNVNEIYNVAGGFEQTNAETVRKIVSAHHNTDDWKQYVDFSYSRQGQDVRYALNDEKLRALGWNPKKVFDEEIEPIVDYYKNNFIW